jgi:hypothetical protein
MFHIIAVTPQLSRHTTTIKILAAVRLGFWLCQFYISRCDDGLVRCFGISCPFFSDPTLFIVSMLVIDGTFSIPLSRKITSAATGFTTMALYYPQIIDVITIKIIVVIICHHAKFLLLDWVCHCRICR